MSFSHYILSVIAIYLLFISAYLLQVAGGCSAISSQLHGAAYIQHAVNFKIY